MSGDDDHMQLRRLSDQAARWLTAFNAAVSTLAVGLIVMFYANIPRELASFRETYASDMASIRADLRAMARAQDDQADSLRTVGTIRDRVLVTEQKVERLQEQVAKHDRRLDELERPPGFFGSGKKK